MKFIKILLDIIIINLIGKVVQWNLNLTKLEKMYYVRKLIKLKRKVLKLKFIN